MASGQPVLVFVALTTIEEGAEITFDYQDEFAVGTPEQCFCGEERCRGMIGARVQPVVGTALLPKTGTKRNRQGSGNRIRHNAKSISPAEASPTTPMGPPRKKRKKTECARQVLCSRCGNFDPPEYHKDDVKWIECRGCGWVHLSCLGKTWEPAGTLPSLYKCDRCTHMLLGHHPDPHLSRPRDCPAVQAVRKRDLVVSGESRDMRRLESGARSPDGRHIGREEITLDHIPSRQLSQCDHRESQGKHIPSGAAVIENAQKLVKLAEGRSCTKDRVARDAQSVENLPIIGHNTFVEETEPLGEDFDRQHHRRPPHGSEHTSSASVDRKTEPQRDRGVFEAQHAQGPRAKDISNGGQVESPPALEFLSLKQLAFYDITEESLFRKKCPHCLDTVSDLPEHVKAHERISMNVRTQNHAPGYRC